MGARGGARKQFEERSARKMAKQLFGEFLKAKEEIMRVDFFLYKRGKYKVKLVCTTEACTNNALSFQYHMRGMSHMLSPSLPWRDKVQHRSLQCSLLEIISSGQKALLEATAISKC